MMQSNNHDESEFRKTLSVLICSAKLLWLHHDAAEIDAADFIKTQFVLFVAHNHVARNGSWPWCYHDAAKDIMTLLMLSG